MKSEWGIYTKHNSENSLKSNMCVHVRVCDEKTKRENKYTMKLHIHDLKGFCRNWSIGIFRFFCFFRYLSWFWAAVFWLFWNVTFLGSVDPVRYKMANLRAHHSTGADANDTYYHAYMTTISIVFRWSVDHGP